MWESFTTADGVAGWVAGDGDRLVLVLHGGPGLSDYTEGLGDEVLAGGDGGLRVVRYQQRGQAPSTREGPLTLSQHTLDSCAVMDHFGSEEALVVGHSWGAHLAMHVAVAHPDRVSGLLLIDALGGVGDGGAGEMYAVITSRLDQSALAEIAAIGDRGLEPAAAGIAQLALMWPGYFADPATAPPMPPMEMSLDVSDVVMPEAMHLLGEGFLAERLPALSIPSLHMIGRHSPIAPDVNRQTAALMADSIVEEYDTGHFIWIEQPGTVTAATRRLLAAV